MAIGEVISLEKEPDELTMICDCVTMYVLTTGEIECSMCGKRFDDDITAYKPESTTEIPKPDDVRQRTFLESPDFALNSVLKRAHADKTAAAIVINMDGGTHVWTTGMKDDDERAWFQERVDVLMQELE